MFKLLRGGVHVDENRQTGETSPTVRFVDFESPANNSFLAVCQFKVRILGTDRHILPDIVLFLNGLPVVVIEAKSPKVKELLASTASDLVMAMIHKFQESDLETTFPELNASPHILVMTDEAHRTQYSLLGANLDKAIPNATKIGYTGTPIDKTERVFVGIVIVNNMLLTGFDAPVEQVLYLDKIIVAHGLLQAITRVNRVAGDAKEKGFVVDYVGIGHHLKKALGSYDEREQKEVLDVLSFPEQELRDLQASHTAIFALLKAHGLTNLKDYDAFYDTFYGEDIRFEFLELFKTFARRLNLVLPAKEALDYLPDLKALSEINVMAGKHFHDSRMSMKGVPRAGAPAGAQSHSPVLGAVASAYHQDGKRQGVASGEWTGIGRRMGLAKTLADHAGEIQELEIAFVVRRHKEPRRVRFARSFTP